MDFTQTPHHDGSFPAAMESTAQTLLQHGAESATAQTLLHGASSATAQTILQHGAESATAQTVFEHGASSATALDSAVWSILQLVMLATWKCLSDTPYYSKNTLFARYLTSLEVMTEIALDSSIDFAPGLFDVLQSTTAPSIQFFKGLPAPRLHQWGVYAVVLEKLGFRPKLYVGSGTSHGGVKTRLGQYHYENQSMVPVGVRDALTDGYSITHQGLFCWVPMPTPTSIPLTRLLFIALEATFAYLFWAMKPHREDYGMVHICPWDRLEYDGICSHCSLKEKVVSEFNLTPEELEAHAAEREERRRELHRLGNSNWHYQQMMNNYDEYITNSSERVARSRANNPGRDAAHQARRIEEALRDKTYHCERCNISFGTKQRLANHEKTPKHKRKLRQANNPFVCGPCDLGFANQSNLTRHNKTERHRKAVAAARL
ncbi:hypothetical protein CDV36_003400 [Fusarium kuroshium]|uniref:C2H2-type domain-containing protein n=1 Tax=Fusarium kuroshium TaxID=2010991 RepID=A0A3M2SH97_9HYPO|nr:hypothetical protein CDV36_003400 [Fusarium kuroshium]